MKQFTKGGEGGGSFWKFMVVLNDTFAVTNGVARLYCPAGTCTRTCV